MNNKFDYVTATIEEEKERLEKYISYLEEKDNNNSELLELKERYNNIYLYINAKQKYLEISKNLKLDEKKLNELKTIQDEYELDNMLLEDTLLSKFHEDTHNFYRNITNSDINSLNGIVKEILLLLFDKKSDYQSLLIKRTKLKNIIDKNRFPNTYITLNSQALIIDKQDNIQNDIFIIENNIKIEKDKVSKIEDSVLTLPILKILYEFLIIDSYDINKIDRNKIFLDNRSLLNIKNIVSSN